MNHTCHISDFAVMSSPGSRRAEQGVAHLAVQDEESYVVSLHVLLDEEPVTERSGKLAVFYSGLAEFGQRIGRPRVTGPSIGWLTKVGDGPVEFLLVVDGGEDLDRVVTEGRFGND